MLQARSGCRKSGVAKEQGKARRISEMAGPIEESKAKAEHSLGLRPPRLCVERRPLGFLGLASDGMSKRAVEGGLGFLVFLLRDLALLVFHFQLKDLFLQGLQQHGG